MNPHLVGCELQPRHFARCRDEQAVFARVARNENARCYLPPAPIEPDCTTDLVLNVLALPLAVQRLDEVDPQWHTRINVDTLNLADPQHCIVGQAFGYLYQDDGNCWAGYGATMELLRLPDPGSALSDNGGYLAAWCKLIRLRRGV